MYMEYGNVVIFTMKKLLKPKDILLLGLAGVGDTLEEARDPLSLAASAYKNVYGFVPRRYTRNNFLQMVRRSLKTQDIEKIVKDGKVYLRLTSSGRDRVKRDFPITSLTKKWNKHWVVVIFDIEEKSKGVRDRLRSKLKSIGFGMLQKSIWISPLSIGENIKEVIQSIGLSKDAFVMEVSGFLFGDPKELVRRIWHLDKLEEECTKLKNRISTVNQLVEKVSDRVNKREAKLRKSYDYDILRKKREEMKNYLEFMVNFPPLPRELLPKSLQNVFSILS